MGEPMLRRVGEDGSRYYEHPSRTEPDPSGPPGATRPARYLSVTQALTVFAKPALVFWSANLAARRAMQNLPKLIGSVLVDDCGRSRARKEPWGCGVCVACNEAWVSLFHVGEKARRAREGTALHDVLETWTKTGEWIYRPVFTGDEQVDQYVPTHDDMAPYMANLQRFVVDYGLTPQSWVVCECTIFNHTFKYGGTLDGVVDFYPVTKLSAELCARINHSNGQPVDRSVRLVVDLKSREGEGAEIYTDHPLQLAPYRHAETMLPKLAAPEMEAPMLATDGAAILQVRQEYPGGYTLRPVVTDGHTMKAFRAILDVANWAMDRGEESTLVRAFPTPPGWKYAPPAADGEPVAPKKRAPRKATATKRAPRKSVAAQEAEQGDTAARMATRQYVGQGSRASISDDDIPF